MITIDEMRDWLNKQKSERITGRGLRDIAKQIDVHENTLYGICRGNLPNYQTAEKLRAFIESEINR